MTFRNKANRSFFSKTVFCVSIKFNQFVSKYGGLGE